MKTPGLKFLYLTIAITAGIVAARWQQQRPARQPVTPISASEDSPLPSNAQSERVGWVFGRLIGISPSSFPRPGQFQPQQMSATPGNSLPGVSP